MNISPGEEIMTDEELDKKVWEIIREEIENIELPDYVKFEESENGHIIFKLDFNSTVNGEMNVIYKLPVEMAKHLLTPSEKGIEALKSHDLAEEFVSILARSYIKNWLISFAVEIETAFSLLYLIPNLFYEKLMNSKPGEYLKQNNELRAKYLKHKNQSSQKIIKDVIKKRDEVELSTKRVRLILAHFYDLVFPKWKEAKSFYDKNKQYDKWREMLDLAVDVVFPSDLIDKLADLDSYEAMPSNIALEQAARLCDFAPYSLSLRTKQKYLEESRAWIKKNGEEEKENLVAEYFSMTKSSLDFQTRLHESIFQNSKGLQFIHYVQEWFWLNAFKKTGQPIKDLLWKENSSEDSNAETL